jgi:hypothetical protein
MLMHYTYFGTSSSDSNQSIAPPVCVIKLYDPTSTMDTIIKYDKAVGYLKTPPPPWNHARISITSVPSNST